MQRPQSPFSIFSWSQGYDRANFSGIFKNLFSSVTVALVVGNLVPGLPGAALAEKGANPIAQVPDQVPEASHSSEHLGHLGHLKDGVYLYGQSSEPEQLGQAYLVFEAQNNQVVGAFYMPFSSFDCFSGTVESDRLALTIVNTYTDEAYDYSVARIDSDPIATTGEALAEFNLEGFHPIAPVSDNDYRILGICKTDL